MSDFNGSTLTGLSPAAYCYVGSQAPGIFERELTTVPQGRKLEDPLYTGLLSHVLGDLPEISHDYLAEQTAGVGGLWFERLWYLPVMLELGNILTTITSDIEIYNSDRELAQSLDTAVNNAGTGVSFLSLPTLPFDLGAQSGMTITVQISTEGQPVINGTLDFTTSLGDFSIPITGSRVVMFPYEPEQPIREILEFKTDVLRAVDGSEQRINVRKNPRQKMELYLRMEDGASLRRLVSLLKGWHERVFGVPVWWEARALGADAATSDLTITVDTSYGDFRVDGLAILWTDEDTYDALEIDSFDANSITFTSALTQDFVANETLVMPLRVANTESTIDRDIYPVNLQDFRLVFHVIDNDVDLADTAAFDTHNGKVMVDEPNLMTSSTTPAGFERQIEIIDNGIGVPQQFSTWLASASQRQKGFLGYSRQRIWEVRQLMHALRGSQTSFYLPTHTPDMVVVQNLASGSFLMDIEHQGYTKYVNGQEPYASLWIELVDGTVLTRQVTTAEELSSTTERLTVDVAWPSTITVAEINRVCFLELVRISDDRVLFRHQYPGQADIVVSVRGTQT